ncbi:hypothetical protein, partial [Pseudomonas sp. SST3]|uniref:hypothetical protein n=1 Tax=Pseudomonas sp. SST3 TaxID=2267882 RepID=UPI0019D687BB
MAATPVLLLVVQIPYRILDRTRRSKGQCGVKPVEKRHVPVFFGIYPAFTGFFPRLGLAPALRGAALRFF